MTNAISTLPRTDASTCVVCRKKFTPGDRVTTCFIVEKIGRNPETREFGAFLSENFEMAHINCADPALSGRVIS
jgi:hypothetical protein